MFNKKLVGLFLAMVCTFINVNAYACGAFTHMYIAKKALEQIQDEEIKTIISKNMEAYYLGANFPDVGYAAGKLGGKDYGESTHWDEFLNAFKRTLFKSYKRPMTDAPAAFSFLMGVATHRVSDDIWHNYMDSPTEDSSSYQFKTCDKSTSPFCYYGFIAKLADLEALPRDEAHPVADTGIDYAVILDKGMGASFPSQITRDNMPFDILVEVFKDSEFQAKWGNFNITVADILIPLAEYKLFAVDGIRTIAPAGLAVLQTGHKMDWARTNYETDPDVGLNAIIVHVTKFISKLGSELR